MTMKLILLLFVSTVFSCGDDNGISPAGTDHSNDADETEESTFNPPNVLGMDYTQSKVSFDSTYVVLRNTLEANPNISIVAEVDHQANAASVDKLLNPTKVIFFGNPDFGTPLMQRNPLAGLDLPQKILVYQNDGEEVYVGFNNTTYLSNRHGLDSVETLPMIQGALTNLCGAASQDSVVVAANSKAHLEEGINTKTVDGSCDDAYSRLRAAIENNSALKIIAELDHQANAAKVDLELNPTRIIIFGNPNLGTPLMENKQTTALDLPQKMLVWTDADGVAHVSYNDPAFLVRRHGITENEEVLQTIAEALAKLSEVAINKP